MIPGDYERQALLEIRHWKNPCGKGSSGVFHFIDKSPAGIGDAVLRKPGVDTVLRSVISALINVCNDTAQWSVRPRAIFNEFRRNGCGGVECLGDIGALPLENIDKTLGRLAMKYKGLALAEGVGAGLAGIAGLALDIPSLVMLNLRAIGEYATYYGFDIDKREERLFALQILNLVSSPAGAAKNIAMARLLSIGKDIAKNRTWRQLEKYTLVNMLRKIAETLGIRLTKAKLAQTLPIIGAVVGGGYNIGFTAQVCDAAHFLYRERFLARNFGPAIFSGATTGLETGQYVAPARALIHFPSRVAGLIGAGAMTTPGHRPPRPVGEGNDAGAAEIHLRQAISGTCAEN